MTRLNSSIVSVLELAEDRDHGAVDPDVDGAELGLGVRRRRVDGPRIGDVGAADERAPAGSLDVLPRALEPGLAARDQRHATRRRGRSDGGRAPHAGRGAGDDHDLGCRFSVDA